jgi:hypothetical protein
MPFIFRELALVYASLRMDCCPSLLSYQIMSLDLLQRFI